MKNIYKILAIIFLNATSFAQTPNWQWARSAGYTGSEAAIGSALDNSGNLYVVGWYTSANITFGSTTLINAGAGTSDIFLVKYDPVGTVLWAKGYGGIDGDLGNGVTVDVNGNVCITGWYTSASFAMDATTLTNAGSTTADIFTAKINPTGTVIWAKTIGGTATDRGYGITSDASGNIFVTGLFGSTSINFGAGALTNAGTSTFDVYVNKYDGNGNALWSRSAGGSGSEGGYSASTDASGNVYVTGLYASATINFGTGNLTNASAGTKDIFIVKYNSAGTAQWSTGAGGALDDNGNSIVVNNNSVYTTGAYNSASIMFGSTTLTNASPATSDVFIVKQDLSGNVSWAKTAGGTDSESGNSIAADGAGNIYVTGYYASNTLAFGTNTIMNGATGTRDIFLASFNTTGNPSMLITAGDVFDDMGNAISVNAGGTDVHIAGMFNSPQVAFGTNVVFKGCGDDVFAAKLQGVSIGIWESEMYNEKGIYPNPSTGKFTVKANGHLTIYNAIGEIVESVKLNEGQFASSEIDLSSQPKGVYFYHIVSDKKETASGKVVIQ